MNEKLNKTEVKFEGTLLIPSQFEVIEKKVESAKNVKDILPEIVNIENIKVEMENAKKELDLAYRGKLEEYNTYYKKLLDTQKIYKALALKDAEESKVVEEKVVAKIDKDTGEAIQSVKKTVKVDLPKGITYISGRISYDYKEELLPDKFFKKVVKKLDAKKAFESGELPVEAVIPKIGKPSISIDRVKLSQAIEGEK